MNKPYTTEEFAALTRRSPKTVRRWIKRQLILASQAPGTRLWLIPQAEAVRFFEKGANK